MNWMEFFFGWLIKEQYRLTVLDSFMCGLEIILVFIISVYIFCWYIERKEGDK